MWCWNDTFLSTVPALQHSETIAKGRTLFIFKIKNMILLYFQSWSHSLVREALFDGYFILVFKYLQNIISNMSGILYFSLIQMLLSLGYICVNYKIMVLNETNDFYGWELMISVSHQYLLHAVPKIPWEKERKQGLFLAAWHHVPIFLTSDGIL